MGIFFKSEPVLTTVHAALQDALAFDPNRGIASNEASARAKEVQKQVSGELQWGRVWFALLIAAALLGTAIYTAQHDLADISGKLMTSFESFAGLVVGLLGGEAAAKR